MSFDHGKTGIIPGEKERKSCRYDAGEKKRGGKRKAVLPLPFPEKRKSSFHDIECPKCEDKGKRKRTLRVCGEGKKGEGTGKGASGWGTTEETAPDNSRPGVTERDNNKQGGTKTQSEIISTRGGRRGGDHPCLWKRKKKGNRSRMSI